MTESSSAASHLEAFRASGTSPTPSRSDTPDRSTRAVRCGVGSDPAFGAVMPPLHLSANFTFAALGEPRRYDYTRSGNPTRDQLADAIAALEGAAGGVVTSSGTSAIALVLQLLRPGDRVVATRDCYGGTDRLLRALGERGAFDVWFLDLSRREGRAEAERLAPRLIWVETPSNPLLRITGLEAVAELARRCDAVLAVDNTLLSPALQCPLDLGADLVVHSTTKFLNGHSDVVGGVVVARDEGLVEELGWWANCLGLTGAPFDAYLTLRGLRTLGVRVAQQQESAERLAGLLAEHESVRRVYYPGLPDHPGHAIAASQQRGWGSMLSFELRGGSEAVRALVSRLRLFSLAESLGGVESLIAHPETMTHAAMDPQARREVGIGESLLRLSIGLEHPDDLLADLAAALDAVAQQLAVSATRPPRSPRPESRAPRPAAVARSRS